MKDGQVRVGDFVETTHPGFNGRPVVVEVLEVTPRPRWSLIGDWVKARDTNTGIVGIFGPREFMRVVPKPDQDG